MLTVLLTSPRVAPGLLTWEAWAALREAYSVFAPAGFDGQADALADAGVEVSPGAYADAVAAAAGGKRVVWLAPPSADPAEFPDDGRVIHGSADLPGAHLIDTVAVMDTLRESCPWDRKQTHSSLLRYLLEEAYEAAEAIELADMASLREELGDVLLQVLFHARVASERSADTDGFTIDDVADVLAAKLRRRHPHVFGSVSVSSADDVNRNWEEIKKAERASASGDAPPSVLDGVVFGQPALSLAAQLQRRAARAGFPAAEPGENGAGGNGAGGNGAGVGEELMALVARARETGADPELELREASRRFAARVRAWEHPRP